MPTVQPAELWKESGRWSKYGPELLRFKDRHDREFAYGPTHEEVITDIARRELRSYKQLPVNFYQIQSKFRDEIRPRFGVMRAREFLMKDAYSFHIDEPSLAQGYRVMFDAYTRIFTRMGLKFRAVQADGGSIGGSVSQEFHVLADSGEDAIAFSDAGDYASNIETAATLRTVGAAPGRRRSRSAKVSTPNAHTIAELGALLGVDADADASRPCWWTAARAMWSRSCCAATTNSTRSKRRSCPASPIRCAWRAPSGCARRPAASPARSARSGSPARSTSITPPRSLPISSAAPTSTTCISPASTGAATCPSPRRSDIRNVLRGRPEPERRGTLEIARGIEVGHIFQLGQLYSEAMHATVLDEQGKSVHHVHGLLRHRRHARRRRGHRTESRCQRHHLAGAHRAVQRRPGADQLPEVRTRCASRPIGSTRSSWRPASMSLLDDRDARPGREIRRCRAHRHPAPHRHRRSGPCGRKARISSPARDRIHRNSRRGCRSLCPRIGQTTEDRVCRGRAVRFSDLALACSRIAARCRRRRARTSSATRSSRSCLQKIIGSRDCFVDKYESEVWYKAMEPRLARYVAFARGAHQHPRSRVLRGQARSDARAAARSGAGPDRGGEPIRLLGGLARGCRRPDAGDAVLAAPAGRAEPTGARRAQHPHGLRDPALSTCARKT